MIPKQNLLCINEHFNCQEAIELLETNGLRCIPVLDATNTIFRGNIYRYHLYQHHFRNPDTPLHTLAVTHFLKNTTKVVRHTDSLFDLFFTMKDLPYLAILNEQNQFIGIVQHDTLTKFFAESWITSNGKYVLEITFSEHFSETHRLTRLISRYTEIVGIMTLDETIFDTKSKILFILPSEFPLVQLKALERHLHRKGFDVNYSVIH